MKRVLAAILICVGSASIATEPDEFRQDAELVERLIDHQYAYLDRLPDNDFELTQKLKAEAAEVQDLRELVRFTERALLLLEDHHAITGASLSDSWAVVPSYSDLWIEQRGTNFVVDQVRDSSPAWQAGIRSGDLLVAIGSLATSEAVEEFWNDLGLMDGSGDGAFAARVLAAGRRDRPRSLTFQRGPGEPRKLQLESLYSIDTAQMPMLSVAAKNDSLIITFHDSLGQNAAIEAFDKAMAQASPNQHIIVDLTDTPGGGNSVVARGIMGWFVQHPTAYQIHRLPTEERRTGIARQWVEQVLPREGKYHSGPLTVRVGRWTGSMGEGLAIGLDSIGARIEGTRMAGLLGAVYDERLPSSQLVVKLPVERLYSTSGVPREEFVPAAP